MRNAGFVVALVAALGVGTLIGWYAIPAMSPAVFTQAPEDAQSTGPGWISGIMQGPSNASEGDLSFSIDTTLPAKGKSGSSPYRPLLADQDAPCSMPSARDALVVVFGVYEGQSLSTVALGSRDEVTGVLDVVIERGDRPLYIILSAYAGTIWRFRGDLDRVQRVVLVAGKTAEPRGWTPLAGTVGLRPEVVTTADYKRCFTYAYQPGTLKAAQIGAIVRRATGKAPDVFAGHYDLAAIRLPSGQGAQISRNARVRAPEGFDPGLWNEMLHYHPGGLVRIDPDSVVSSASVQPYDVLPQQAGLAQLVGSGLALAVADGVKIVRPIPRFPAGLSGAHGTAFLIAQGVPVPDGHPGHSCVIMESTGLPPEGQDHGALCGIRRTRGFNDRPSRQYPVPSDPTARAADAAARAAARAAAASEGMAAADRL